MSSTQRAKVLLLIPHIGGGGAEHIVETLAQHLSARKYEMHLGLVTQSTQETRNFPQVKAVHALGARRVRDGVWTLLWLVWMVRPAVILSGMAHLNLLVLRSAHCFRLAHVSLCVRTGDFRQYSLRGGIRAFRGASTPPHTGELT